MINRNNILTGKILIFFGVIFTILYFSENWVSELLILKPNLVLNNMELWRLASYIFVPGSIEGVFLFTITFYFLAPFVEKVLRNPLYPAYLMLLIFLHGIIHTLAFWKTSINLSGMEGASIFILTFFALSDPDKRVKITFLPSVKSFYFSGAILLTWILVKYLKISFGDEKLLFESVSALTIGIISGTMTFVQIKMIRKFISKKRRSEDYSIPEPEEIKMAVINDGAHERYESILSDEVYNNDFDPDQKEDILNQILDKILEQGQGSLSAQEIYFLENYHKLP